ncbi:hypothetical protein [Deinococcus sp. PEB2-63]
MPEQRAQLLAAAFRRAPIGMALLGTDGAFLDVNDACATCWPFRAPTCWAAPRGT